MPEFSVALIVLLAAVLAGGLVAGWVFRTRQAEGEKAAISAGWKDQLEAQRKEHERLLDQNRSLMEQNSQYQASNKDSKMRAAELSDALKEAFARRDELQRQIKDIRGSLESTLAAREQLEHDIAHRAAEVDVTATALKQRDDRIARLQKELQSWQKRVPPLVERFRERSEQAERLEEKLVAAHERINALEEMVGSEHTRVEPIDPAALGDAFDASNESMESLTEPWAATDDPEADPIAADSANGTGFADSDEDEAQEEDDDQDGDEIDSERDNLKLIKGVGPAIEKTLNEMGIRQLHQIAEMSEYDIDRIARRLKGFRTRIYREDWMGQARNLLEQQDTASQH